MINKILLLLASSLLACALLEFSSCVYLQSKPLQIVYKGDSVGQEGSLFKLSDDPALLYEWRNGLERSSAGGRYAFRCVVIGDSTTRREFPGSQTGDFYPGLLEGSLNQKKGKSFAEVINAGVPGYNTIQEVQYLEKKFLSPPRTWSL